MRITTTNGSRRNKIEGQRVTLTLASGRQFHKTLPAGNAIKRAKYQAQLLDFVHVGAALDMHERHKTAGAIAMIDLFARLKARLAVIHGRREFAA